MHPLLRPSVAALLLAAAACAHAAPVVSLRASVDKIHPPEVFSLDVVVSGLRSAGARTLLGAFDLTLDFDPRVARLEGIDFGRGLGDPADPLQTVTGADGLLADVGRFEFFEVSLLEGRDSCLFCTGPYLDDLQADSFTLASIRLRSPGAPPGVPGGWVTEYLLPRGRAMLADELGNPIAGVTTVGAIVRVPEPTVLALLAAAAMAAWMASRRRPGRPA